MLEAEKQKINLDTSTQQENRGDEDPLISIVIPLYNEEKTIAKVINDIPNHRRYEIIIVDDGSIDKSVERVKKLEKDNLYIYSHEKNKGYGEALMTGLKIANGDILVTIDSDGQHDPREIPNLINPIINGDADFTVGSRYLGKCYFKVPFYTRIGESCVNLFLSLLFNQKVHNNQNGFRAFRYKILKKLDDVQFREMGFTTEFLFIAASMGYRIKEIPITARPRANGESYVNVLNTLISIMLIVFSNIIKRFSKNRIKISLLRYFSKKFRMS